MDDVSYVFTPHILRRRFYDVSNRPTDRQMVGLYRVSQEERSVFWEVTVWTVLSKDVYMYMYMCPIPNGFRDRAVSLYSCKIVDKKEILRTVSNTGIYCSSDKVGTVYLV
jgi:hypothetical protein